jgi:DNA-binding transcriptional LysR family regulator
MENLVALNVFLRVAEARSFTQVGRQLGLSSSAIGKSVRRLEDRLGVCLFYRNTRNVTVSPEGLLFAESCRRIFREVEAVQREFAQSTGEPKGRLRVGVPVVGMVIVPILARFMQAYPNVELDMDFPDRTSDIVEGRYDVVVCSGEAKDSRLKTRCLGRYMYQIVGAPSYFDKTGVPAAPDDLINHACLHQKHGETGKLQPWPILGTKAGGDFALPVTATSSAIEPLVSLAESGVGLACVPDFAVRKQINEGSLVSVLDRIVERETALRAVWPATDYASPKVRAFVDFVAKHLGPASPDSHVSKVSNGSAASGLPDSGKVRHQVSGNAAN